MVLDPVIVISVFVASFDFMKLPKKPYWSCYRLIAFHVIIHLVLLLYTFVYVNASINSLTLNLINCDGRGSSLLESKSNFYESCINPVNQLLLQKSAHIHADSPVPPLK